MTPIHEALTTYFPNATIEELDSVLWGATCYPFGTQEQVLASIVEAAKEGKNDVSAALAWADKIENEALQEIHSIEKFCEQLEIPEHLARRPETWSAARIMLKVSPFYNEKFSIIRTSELEKLREDLQRFEDSTAGEDNNMENTDETGTIN
jgi:hypothetical protein